MSSGIKNFILLNVSFKLIGADETVISFKTAKASHFVMQHELARMNGELTLNSNLSRFLHTAK